MNLRQIRTKIKAIENIKKITNAMELVSSVKMKKTQREYFEGKPYRDFLNTMVERLIDHINKNVSPLLGGNNSVREKLYIVIASNKGLCGSFNYFLFKEIAQLLEKEKPSFVVWGRKATQFLYRVGAKIIGDFSDYPPASAVSALFDFVLNKFLEKEFGEIFLLYNQFISPTVYRPVKKRILPLKIETEDKKTTTGEDYLFEPSADTLVDPLLRNLIELQIHDAVLSSQASEHSARMIAMKNATDNAKELVYNLTLLRNRVRQEKITYELLDMITAKESITPSDFNY